MIKNTIKANGKTAAWVVLFPVADGCVLWKLTSFTQILEVLDNVSVYGSAKYVCMLLQDIVIGPFEFSCA